MKHRMYGIFFLIILSTTPLAIGSKETIFNFDLNNSAQQEEFLASDYYAEADSSYDAMCDRSPVVRAPFYRRMATHFYLFCDANFLRIKKIILNRSLILKHHLDTFFKGLALCIKQLKNKTS